MDEMFVFDSFEFREHNARVLFVRKTRGEEEKASEGNHTKGFETKGDGCWIAGVQKPGPGLRT